MPRLLIKVRTCYLCPFAHRDVGDLFGRYCAIHLDRPTVTDWHERGKMPGFCPLLHNDYLTLADVHISPVTPTTSV